MIGEEILDEFDLKGAKALPASSYVPAEAQRAVDAANAKASAAAGVKEKTDPLGVSVGVPPTVTPNASTTNLRLAQGLRAIRLKAGGGSSPPPSGPNAAGSVAVSGGKRTMAPSPLSAPQATGPARVDATPETAPVPEKAQSPSLPAAAAIALPASAPGSAKMPTIALPPPPPFSAIAGGGTESAVPENIPMARGGSKGATKKRPFKSLIAGENATPGLEKRGDPFAVNKASGGPSGLTGGALNTAPAPVDASGSGGGYEVDDKDPKDKPRETNFENKPEGE